jgi:hypothetical protein
MKITVYVTATELRRTQFDRFAAVLHDLVVSNGTAKDPGRADHAPRSGPGR